MQAKNPAGQDSFLKYNQRPRMLRDVRGIDLVAQDALVELGRVELLAY